MNNDLILVDLGELNAVGVLAVKKLRRGNLAKPRRCIESCNLIDTNTCNTSESKEVLSTTEASQKIGQI